METVEAVMKHSQLAQGDRRRLKKVIKRPGNIHMVREEIENVWVGWGLDLVVENERVYRMMSSCRQARYLIRRI